MGSADDRILIAGGGVAGLAAARALNRSGIASLVVERRAGPADAGLAINLPGNAISALAALGLGEMVEAVGRPVRRREYRNETGRLLFAIDEDDFWGADARPRAMRRSDLLQMLGHDLGKDAVRLDCGFASFRDVGPEVRVELTDGTTEAGALLVGADGVHSAVRRAMFQEQAVSAALLARASWRFMAPNPGVDCWTLWAGAGGLFLLLPVDKGEVYGWVAANGATAEEVGLGAVLPVFARFPRIVRETLDAVLSDPGSIYLSPLEEIRIPSWTAGRALLVGDAAHATAPVWAQGAALALEDAVTLAALARQGDWTRIGREYERQRRARVTHVQAMSDRMSRTNALPDWLRNMLAPFVGPRTYRATYEPLRSSLGHLGRQPAS